MNKMLFKIFFKRITSSLSQFLSITAITMVGVLMYVGVLSVPPTMQENAKTYLNNLKTSDVELVKPTGFTNKEIKKITDNEDVKADKSIIADASLYYEKQEIFSRLHSTTKQNLNYIVEGRNIKKDNECLISDYSKINLLNKKITLDIIKEKTCQVVGIIQAPQYLSDHNKGYSTKSVGEIEILVYAKETFVKDFFKDIPYYNPYNSLSLTYNNKESTDYFSNEYAKEMKDNVTSLEKLLDDDTITITSANNNQSIKDYNSDSSKISEIAAIFPIIFFLVATMVASSTISRIVEDERMQLGTLSSLGYSKFTIILQYFLYALLAIITGGSIGIIIGFNLIPTTVMKSYETLYPLANYYVVYDLNIILQAIILSCLLITGSACLVTYSQIKNSCATLLRPKAPLAGKKTLIENLSLIWNRLSFLNKVNLRNLFRYKKRLLMSTLAIMGCSGLLMTGFGIKSSLGPIVNKQYNDIYHYNLQANTINLNNEETTEFIKTLQKDKNIVDIGASNRQIATTTYKDNEYDLNIITPQSITKFNEMITFNHKFTKDDIVITNKLADILHLKKGDKLTIELNKKDYEFTITNITSQYIGNYLYLNKEAYAKTIGNISYNNFFIQSKQINESIIKLEDNNKILTLMDTTALKDIVNDSLSGVNNLVYILIVLAGLLVMIVMYTLTNINLIERRRELATLKVLGFFEREIETYVFKENIILTALGLIVGLIFGKYLHIYIMSRVELADIYFIREQPLQNYIYTIVLTFLFSITVNLIMKKKLEHINMIESLKSVE